MIDLLPASLTEAIKTTLCVDFQLSAFAKLESTIHLKKPPAFIEIQVSEKPPAMDLFGDFFITYLSTPP